MDERKLLWTKGGLTRKMLGSIPISQREEPIEDKKLLQKTLKCRDPRGEPC